MPEPVCMCGHIRSLHVPTGDQAASRCTGAGCDCRAYEHSRSLYTPPPPPDPDYLHPNDPARRETAAEADPTPPSATAASTTGTAASPPTARRSGPARN